MEESRLWEINARLARVLPLTRDEAALSRLVQHVHPDAPADQVHLLVDDLRTLVERNLPTLTTARVKSAHKTFDVGDTVRWCWTGENATGRWFTARLTAHRPAEFPAGWSAELVDPGTFYGPPDHYWQLDAGEIVYVDEPSLTLLT